jgi:hypothetical protein
MLHQRTGVSQMTVRRLLPRMLLGIVLIAAGYAVGVVWGMKRLYPVDEVIAAAESLDLAFRQRRLEPTAFARWQYQRHFGELKWVEEIHPDALKTDASGIIGVREADDADRMRERLYRYIWKAPDLPRERLPDVIERGIADERYSGIESLDRIDRYVVDMAFGINSIVYHFHPARPGGRPVIYHQGHRGDFVLGKEMIADLLDAGHDVLAFAMPFEGMNAAPDIDSPRFGYIKNFGHNTFHLLESDELAPIKFFLEPLVAVINLLEREQAAADCLGMVGISGGGWTTILYSALDDRICRSWPVAGKLPVYLLALPPNDRNTNNRADKVVGDYEEFVPELNQIANFLELSVLGAKGENRRQTQVINKYDRLTYRGVGARHYEPAVKAAVQSLGGGDFSVVIDETHTLHEISPAARAMIVKDMAAE